MRYIPGNQFINNTHNFGKYFKRGSVYTLKNIKKEYDTLSSVAKSIKENNPDEFAILYSELLDVNNQLWEIEDKIRILEKEKKFDSDFIETARNVYIINDERFQIKSKINSLFDSEIIEEKDYEDYT